MAVVHELAGKQFASSESSRLKQEHLGKLFEHMYDISGDHSGSEPSLYLRKEDEETLEQFLELAFELNWVDSEPIDMRVSRVPGVKAFPHGMHTARTGLSNALFFHQTGPQRRGYAFARLNMAQTQRVAICDDGLFRSKRGPELASGSKGKGWGVLPRPDYMLPYLEPVSLLLSHAPQKSLAESLLSRIQPPHLRAAPR